MAHKPAWQKKLIRDKQDWNKEPREIFAKVSSTESDVTFTAVQNFVHYRRRKLKKNAIPQRQSDRSISTANTKYITSLEETIVDLQETLEEQANMILEKDAVIAQLRHEEGTHKDRLTDIHQTTLHYQKPIINPFEALVKYLGGLSRKIKKTSRKNTANFIKGFLVYLGETDEPYSAESVY